MMLKRGMQGKKAQVMGLSFQAIFSIILIIVFIAAAGIVARTLLRNVENAQILQFKHDLSAEVEGIWGGVSFVETSIKLSLPAKIDYVCFIEKNKLMEDIDESDFPTTKIYDALSWYGDEDADAFFYKPEVAEGHGLDPFTTVACGSEKKRCLDSSEIDGLCCIKNIEGIVTISVKKEMGNPDVIFVPDNCI